MSGGTRSNRAGWIALAVLAVSTWAFWILPRQWAGTPVRVDFVPDAGRVP